MDNLRRIILIFSIVIFLALTISGIVLSVSNISKPTENVKKLDVGTGKYDGSTTDPSATPETKVTEALVNKLFIVKGNGTADNIYFVTSLDKTGGMLNVTFIPAATKVSVKNSANEFVSYTLDELREKSMAMLTEGVSGILGITVEKYMEADLEGFGTFVNYFTSRDEGVLFYMPCDIDFDYEGKKVQLLEGEQYFSGLQATKLLSFQKTDDDTYPAEILKYYDGTETARLKIAGDFITSFIKQKLTKDIDEFYKTNYKSYWDSFIESDAKTNISANDTNQIKENMMLVSKDSVIMNIYTEG